MNTLSKGEIVGIVIAIIVVIIIIVIVICLVFFCCWRLHGSRGNLVLALSPTPERENNANTKRRNYSSSVPSIQSFKESLLSLNKPSHHASHYELSLENAYVKHSYDRSTSVADSWCYSPKFEHKAETFPRLPNQHVENEREFVVSTFPRSGPSFTAGMEPPSHTRAQSMGSMYEVPVVLHHIKSTSVETEVRTPSTYAAESDMV